MPPTKATKKERGCFQCSRRRIICDRTEPSCLKCNKKGIECSGLGRIRFAEGVARRGRFKDFKIPTADGNDDNKDLPTTTEFQTLRWPGEESSKTRVKSNVGQVVLTPPAETPAIALPDDPLEESRSSPPPVDILILSEEDDCEIEDIGRGHDCAVPCNTQELEISPWIAPVDTKLRMLFSYCKPIH